MLTLKVISRDRDGQKNTYIISGARISYNQMEGHPGDVFHIENGNRIFGIIPNESKGDKDDFVYFGGRITDMENAIIEDFMIFPYSECFVMEEGKTVDVFISKFI